MIHFEGLRKKIIKNYFIIIITTITLFEGLFIFYAQNYYYDSVKQSLKHYADNATNLYSGYMSDSSFEQKINYIYEKRDVVNSEKIAIEIIDKNKNLIIDQYGFRTKEKVNYEDVNEALRNNTKTST
ncbi:MAG: sensor histidine kinase, partial [Paraclostridium sp.]